MEAPVAELREQIACAVTRHGHGRWRLRDDLIDHAYNVVVDHLLRNTAPTDPDHFEAWLATICLNLARRGPPRAELDRRTVVPIAEALLTSAAAPATPRHHMPPFGVLLIVAPEVLTPTEQCVLDAVQTNDTVTAAASAAGMSPRDFRTRLGRIAGKLRRALTRSATPLSAHCGTFPRPS